MTITWAFDKDDLGRLESRFGKIEAALEAPRVRDFLRKEVHPHVRTRVIERFRSQGDDAVGGQWEDLQDATLKWRAYFIARDGLAIRPSSPINVRTGRLRAFVSRSFEANETGPRRAELVQPGNKATTPHILTKLRRAQRGDRRTFARPVIALDHTDQLALERRTHDWVERILKAR